jgi:FixJ family two-component response regulator
VDFSELKAIVDRALADKVLTRAEQQQIMEAVLADNQISPEEHDLLESIVDKISNGEIQAVDC